jgi:branched-chain amino acid transport system permease protein
MGDFLQTLIIAITLGSLYALIALGYTMVYGILKLINFAHSDVVVLGAWISFTLATFFPASRRDGSEQPSVVCRRHRAAPGDDPLRIDRLHD